MGIKLLECVECKGAKYITCEDWRCPTGQHECGRCNGKGKVLSPKDRKRKEELQKLLEYK